MQASKVEWIIRWCPFSATMSKHETSKEEVEDSDDDAFPAACTAHDVLRELLWYVQKKKLSGGGGAPGVCAAAGDLLACLRDEGILFWRDRRFAESQKVALQLAGLDETLVLDGSSPSVTEELQKTVAAVPMDYCNFVQLVSPCAGLFLRAFNEEHVIPDWSTFVADLSSFFNQSAGNTEGENAQYIPVLKNANPDRWGLSVCSVDGQRFSIGDSTIPFSLQSVSKPVTYAMGLAKEGEQFMEEWIDVEPAGRPFNTQDLDPNTNRPFNASINSGAIMAAGVVASAFSESTPWRDIVDRVRATWSDLCGNDTKVRFSEETFQSEKETAYNNFAIAYNLKGRRGLPRDVDLHKMLYVYLGCCSIEVTAEALSVAAGTLANGGICPITGKEVFPSDVVRSVLAETLTCGMYDQAGRFAVEVGLPAKSGVSGAIMVIVPNVFGFATFSPRLNAKGNSVRGYEFCKRLVNCYRLHVFEPLRNGNTGAKIDPRHNGWKDERNRISHLAWAASVGDAYALQVRDIFLYALVQTAMASHEGLSKHKMNIIRDQYEQIFLVHLDEGLFNRIQETTKKHRKDVQFWKDLTRDVQITDSMKRIIFRAMTELILVDGHMNVEERKVVVGVAALLGVHERVALLELDRKEHHVGHRFEDFDLPDMIEELSASVHGGSRHSKISTSSKVLPLEREDVNVESNGGQEEAFELRRKIVRLGKKFARTMSRKPRKYEGYFE
jgi:glutaminase